MIEEDQEQQSRLLAIMERYVEASKKGELLLDGETLLPEERQIINMLNEGIDNYRKAIMAETQDIDKIENEIETKAMDKEEFLHTMHEIATKLLASKPEGFHSAIYETMGIMADIVDVDRVYIWKNHEKEGEPYTTQIYEWSERAEPQQNLETTVDLPHSYASAEIAVLKENKSVSYIVKNMTEESKSILVPQGVKSILLIPIFIDNKYWGFMGIDDCHNEREFTVEEETILISVSVFITAALIRNEKLIEEQEIYKQLEHRDKLLQTVNKSAAILLHSKPEAFVQAVYEVMDEMARAVDVDRVYIWKNYIGERRQITLYSNL